MADFLPITPLAEPPDCSLVPPGSKSLTNRALPLAALCAEPVALSGWLDSDDTRVMIDSLRRLGHAVDEGERLVVRRGPSPARADLFVGNSGTTMRFLTAFAALGTAAVRLDGVPRMRERPIADLLEALRALGVEAEGT
ncbi:MAG: 3-phosphoshikimate 1-carboxyvinyltransferase, partial [Gemmataceae bacterium]|nr:3-phosphoshikimate 1-carboxyvinyltransferase [Gemmataceae bacterium]